MKSHRTQMSGLFAAVLALSVAGAAHGALQPITFVPGSFNADVVVEAGVPSLGTNTTATTDGGTNNSGNSWYEIGYQSPAGTFGPGGASSGVPHAGTILTNVTDLAGGSNNPHLYQLAPSWTAPNAVLIDSGILRTQAVVTFGGSVGPFTKLSFLVASGNGGGNVNLSITHADSTVETNFVTCSDWFNGANPAFIAFGRVAVTSASYDTQGSITSPGNPRWYSRDITLSDTASPITSITCSYGTGGASVHNQIYAISGSSGGAWTTLTLTGYTDDLIVEAGGVPQQRTFSSITATNATSNSMDNNGNTANSWYENGFYAFPPQLATGLPHPGHFLTNSTGDHIFQFAPSYQANDAFYLNPSNEVAEAALAVPTNFTLISLLNSAGNGPVPIGVVIYHLDGTTESNTISSLDWFNGSGKVYGCGGRVAVDTSVLNNENFPFTANAAPYLYENDILLINTNSFVTNIAMYYLPTNAAGRAVVFAISGTQGASLPIIVNAPVGTNMWPVATGSNGPVVLSVQATGIQPITYQWQQQVGNNWVNVVNGPNGDGSTNAGATTSTLTITDETTPGSVNYQVIAHNVGGSITSTPPATVVVLSPLVDVLASGDPGTGFPAAPLDNEPNEGHEHSWDHLVGADPGKYLNFGINNGAPFLGPVGFTVTPSAGYSIISGVRIYTANDTPNRDPIDVEVYGSINNGATWTLISSNSLSLSDNRNAQSPSVDIGASIQGDVLQQVLFPNTTGYFSYKVQFTNVKNESGGVVGAANSMQLGEVELLGYATNAPAPSISAPASVVTYEGSSGVAFTATVSANGYTINSTVWQVQTNGSYVNLSDNANVSGSQSTSLTLNNVPFGLNLSGPSLPASYNLQLVVNSSGGAVTSAPVTLTVISAVPNILSGSDGISDFGNSPVGTGNNAATIPLEAIDQTLSTYINTGVGPNAAAGFAPFAGPCGLIDQPAAGPTIVTGIRFFSGSGAVVDDPANYTLEGSTVGTNGPFVLIGAAVNSLSIPSARNANVANPVDPTVDPMQEIDFNNTESYVAYRLTFHDVVNDSTAVYVDIAELQLLGTFGPGKLSASFGAGGNLTIQSSASGTLVTATNLTSPVWVPVGAITPSTPITITPQAGVPAAFYRVQAN